MEQRICRGLGSVKEIWNAIGAKKVLLVCGGSFDRLPEREALLPPGAELTRFSGFTPNPLYEQAQSAAALLLREGCDAVLAVGGGSAIDTAKCAKLYSGRSLPLVAVPTTAGTGSESTRHAVVYRDGVKQSICDPAILPDYALLVPSLLKSLPPYQKKCALLDALCQGIESWWSVRATEESAAIARAAVTGIAANWRSYIEGDEAAAEQIMEAANASGRAIDRTATTAPHAMSYKLTSLYGIPHGHAVALCMAEVWPYLQSCVDSRGAAHLKRVLAEIEGCFSLEAFRAMLTELGMERPAAREREAELALLTASVNPERLQNNPVPLGEAVLREMYERIVR